MMRRLALLVMWVFAVAVIYADPTPSLDALRNNNAQALLAAHRGCWRLAPENSLGAIAKAIENRIDIVEIDVHSTRDGVLVLMHDSTVDRTTNGSGKVSKLTLAALKKLRLKEAKGGSRNELTSETVPTLEEAFKLGKGKIIFNLDKCWKERDNIMKLARKCGVDDQLIFKGSCSPEEADRWLAKQPKTVMFMPVIGPQKIKDLDAYLKPRPPVAVELCWKNDDGNVFTRENLEMIRAAGSRVWVNTLSESLCGSHGDKVSLRHPKKGWGFLLDQGAGILQTDNPQEARDYLAKRASAIRH